MTKRGQGRGKLIEAAQAEFEEHGYDNTNSNAIAKRAGYAPQTFYRHFEDKRAIFLAVYQQWSAVEVRDVSVAGTPEAIAAALVLLAIVRFVWQVFCLPARLFSRAQSR
jgi:AcrR family transcriptional regulator